MEGNIETYAGKESKSAHKRLIDFYFVHSIQVHGAIAHRI